MHPGGGESYFSSDNAWCSFMKTYIRIYNRKTGHIEDIDFPNIDEAFDAYWKLTDEMHDNDIDFELITSNEDEVS
jgi:hypothetical protein